MKKVMGIDRGFGAAGDSHCANAPHIYMCGEWHKRPCRRCRAVLVPRLTSGSDAPILKRGSLLATTCFEVLACGVVGFAGRCAVFVPADVCATASKIDRVFERMAQTRRITRRPDLRGR
jgi:hypothetical protein